MLDDRLREECGVFGVYNHKDAASLTALGLHALQHRGQEACGINTFDGKNFHSVKRRGLVGDNFTSKKIIDQLPGILQKPYLTKEPNWPSPIKAKLF